MGESRDSGSRGRFTSEFDNCDQSLLQTGDVGGASGNNIRNYISPPLNRARVSRFAQTPSNVAPTD